MSVKLRERKINGGRKSLYLDFYPPIINETTGKPTRREFLKIYVYSRPKNENERLFNEEKRATAEAIRGLREIALKNGEYGFLDKQKTKRDFLQYFKEVAEKHDKSWLITYKHFENYTNNHCKVSDITHSFCEGFKDYLLSARNFNSKLERPVAANTAVSYYGKFRALLKIAFKERVLFENINDRLSSIKPEETHREFLTLDELQTLYETPCEIPILKNASLFSALTGLRYSDIEKLTWGEVQKGSNGGYCIRFRQKKTKGEVTLPISEEALELLGDCGDPEQSVFNFLTYSFTQTPLKKWLLKAGISRNITFHSFRHTYATLQLTLGTDIYTVSKMLGHKKIETTQIYAKIVDEKKRETTLKIKLKR